MCVSPVYIVYNNLRETNTSRMLWIALTGQNDYSTCDAYARMSML